MLSLCGTNDGRFSYTHSCLHTYGDRNSMTNEERLNHNHTLYILMGNTLLLKAFWLIWRTLGWPRMYFAAISYIHSYNQMSNMSRSEECRNQTFYHFLQANAEHVEVLGIAVTRLSTDLYEQMDQMLRSRLAYFPADEQHVEVPRNIRNVMCLCSCWWVFFHSFS